MFTCPVKYHYIADLVSGITLFITLVFCWQLRPPYLSCMCAVMVTIWLLEQSQYTNSITKLAIRKHTTEFQVVL